MFLFVHKYNNIDFIVKASILPSYGNIINKQRKLFPCLNYIIQNYSEVFKLAQR